MKGCTAKITVNRIRPAVRPRRLRDRHGTLVVCVLVCLLVAASLMGAATLNALRTRRSLRLELQMRQTELLLDAGVLRAAKQLQRSDDYQGETWQPSRDRVGFDSPTVTIDVQREPGSNLVQVQVVAQLGSPPQGLERANPSGTRRSHQFTTELPQSPQDNESPSLE